MFNKYIMTESHKKNKWGYVVLIFNVNIILRFEYLCSNNEISVLLQN